MKFIYRRKKNKKRKTSASNRDSHPRSSVRNEVYGLLLIALGILLTLALVSYHPGDPTGFLDENNIYRVKNWLGIAGATISAPLFQWTLGYPALIFPLLIGLAGIYLLLQQPLRKLLRFSILSTLWAFIISVGLVLPRSIHTLGNLEVFYPSGFIGGVIAVFLVRFFSPIGAALLYGVSVLILAVVSFRLRISSVPVFVYTSLIAAVRRLGRLVQGIHLPHKKKIQKKPAPTKRSPEIERTEEIPGELEQPELRPEEQISSEEESIEIIHTEEEEEPESAKITEEQEISGTSEEITEKTSGELGFEVQKVHKEKELDYDSLVRDSLSRYQFPSTDLLIEQPQKDYHLSEEELKGNARLLENTLADFGVKATVTRVVEGPVITLYEVKPAQGVKISKITNLQDDLALNMQARGIRIIAPIPGKAAVGIEIPNRNPSIVHFRSIVRSETFINFQGNLPLGMGKTISGEVYVADLTKMPHLLIAGATNSGKSVGINTMIASLLYRIPPSDLKFVMIDPKKLELSIYAKLKDHYLATCKELDEIVITHPQNAIMILRSVVNEMEERYDKLANLGVREITHYNRKVEEYLQKGEHPENLRKLPYLVVVIDELADLILSATREVEEPITRLAQMARAVGIHLIVATQRPSVDILTGLIKANFPARISYQVATRPDSKTILDMYGAEQLIGRGDMLFLSPGSMKPIRLQNPLITTEEVERIIRHIRKQPKFPPYELKLVRSRTTNGPGSAKAFERDELFEKAKKIVIQYQQGSVSLLQRKLKIGYSRAARIVDELEEAGIVGPMKEGKARDVLVSEYSPED